MVILKIYFGGVMDRKAHFSTVSALVAPMSTIVLLGAPFCASQVAMAADSVAAADSPADQGGLEEIVVTAEKRSSTVQHTALDIAVFNAATLQDSGVEDFSTLYKVAPNVSVNSGGTGGVGNTVISINGIHAFNLSPVTQSPIAVNLDGIYLARMTGLTGMFYDVTRMEVLAGPQGTLYGRNATGGAVNVITNAPGKDFGAYGEVEAGNYGESRVEGALNLPISDALSVRFAGRDYQHQGYFNNGLNDAHEIGGRMSALLTINSKATLSASFDNETSNDHGNGLGLVGVRNLSATISPTGVVTVNPGANVAIPSDPYKNTSVLYPAGLGNSTNNSEIYGGKVQFDYDLDWADLTSLVGYRSVKDYDVFLQPPSPLVGGAVGTQSFPAVSKTYSAEVRLASTQTTPFQWVGGLYAFKEVASGEICVQGVYTKPACVFKEGMNNDSISYAAFAQGTYTPPVDDEKIHFVVGARFNSDEVTSSDFEDAVFPLLHGNVDNPYLNKTSKKGTYKVGVNYDLTRDNLLYISNSTGYRAFNFQYGANPYVPPETIKAYDIGSKNEFFDHHLQVNLDAFWYDYYGSERSEQSYPPAFAPFLPFGDITSFSAGHLRYKGVGLDTAVVITPVDRVRLAVQYIDAKYLDFVIPANYKNTTPENSLGVPTGQTVGDFSGDPIGEVTPFAGSAGYEHDWHVLDGTVAGKLDAQFATRTPMTDANPGTIVDVERPAYIQGDVLFRYTPTSDRWSVSAWCRNFTNKIVWNSAGYGLTSGTASSGIVTALLNPPRTFGVTVTAKIGNP
jgi:iron complex outermembrane receptor protein